MPTRTIERETVVTDDTVSADVVSPVTERVVDDTGTMAHTGYVINQFIWGVIGIIQLLLIVRILILLFGGELVGFARSLYVLTNIFVLPFTGIFPSQSVGDSYFDTAAVLAMLMWAVIGYILTAIISMVMRVERL